MMTSLLVSLRGIARALLLPTLLLLRPAPVMADEVWVRVDTAARTLYILRDDTVLARLEDISIGRGGVSRERRLGDGTTPLGTFHIAWINSDSPFRLFFGFDYPNLDHARAALEGGHIDAQTYDVIREALESGRAPPQTTVLGGMLGIHGLGTSDPEVHRDFNWTKGCIALTNRQVEELARYARIGTRVVVE